MCGGRTEKFEIFGCVWIVRPLLLGLFADNKFCPKRTNHDSVCEYEAITRLKKVADRNVMDLSPKARPRFVVPLYCRLCVFLFFFFL